ncbi:hypothetical protein FPQ18DRAFT_143354 [Pyronema domesticum]|nr:hypothetical protein FPQ18DRAFT_143354 [Pyronema domesticum]
MRLLWYVSTLFDKCHLLVNCTSTVLRLCFDCAPTLLQLYFGSTSALLRIPAIPILLESECIIPSQLRNPMFPSLQADVS